VMEATLGIEDVAWVDSCGADFDEYSRWQKYGQWNACQAEVGLSFAVRSQAQSFHHHLLGYDDQKVDG
jgi:hypothetical protein